MVANRSIPDLSGRNRIAADSAGIKFVLFFAEMFGGLDFIPTFAVNYNYSKLETFKKAEIWQRNFIDAVIAAT